MKSDYLERIKPQVFPRSREQRDIILALAEWFWAGSVTDHGDADADCEMCLQHNLRWHFGIKNQFTGADLAIGSNCIKRYQIVNVSGVAVSSSMMNQAIRDLEQKEAEDRFLREGDGLIDAFRGFGEVERQNCMTGLDYTQPFQKMIGDAWQRVIVEDFAKLDKTYHNYMLRTKIIEDLENAQNAYSRIMLPILKVWHKQMVRTYWQNPVRSKNYGFPSRYNRIGR